MKKIIHSLILSVIIVSILSSCSLFGNSTQADIAAPAANPGVLPAVATIELTVQTESPQPSYKVGDVIKINYVIKNIGTAATPGPVTITGATAACQELVTIGDLNTSLDPTEAFACQSAYTVTQADLDKGSATVVVTATVNGINSNQVTHQVSTLPPAQLSLTKAPNPTTYDHVDQKIIYTYVITNTTAGPLGPVQFTVTDPGIIATPFNCDVPVTLASNATVTCTATYTVTAADMGAPSVTTNATAAAAGITPSQPVGATITKSAVPSTGGTTSNLTRGQTIQHKVIKGEWLIQIARCYGVAYDSLLKANPQLSNPAQISPDMIITVPNIGSAGNIYKSDTTPCVQKYTVKSTDTWNSIAAQFNADLAVLQKVNSTALVVGSEITIPLNSAGSTPIVIPPTSASLTVTSTASPTTYNAAGQAIVFTYIITNSGTGNLGPAQFTVSDGLISATPFNCGAANTTLTPNANVSCTANYSITANDMGATSIANKAIASGGGAGPSQSYSTTITKNIASITLSASANPPTYNATGQLIAFTYIITNNGTGSIGPTQFTVIDGLISVTPFPCGAANTTLAPGANVSCTVNYSVTAGDMTATSFANKATASGGGATSQSFSVTVTK